MSLERKSNLDGNAPLIVIAHRDEAVAFKGIPHELLVTNYGKVNAAIALTERLCSGPRPSEILVFGTAGRIDKSLKLQEVYEISSALEYDSIAGRIHNLYPDSSSPFPTAAIGTGSDFLEDPLKVSILQERGIQLVDMESSVYLQVAETFHLPIRVFKAISDDANSQAPLLWDQVVPKLSEKLYEVYLQVTGS